MSEVKKSTFGCVICARSLTPESKQKIYSTRCGHVYHGKCLKKWFQSQIDRFVLQSCPQCRKSLDAIEIHQLYLHEIESSAAESEEEEDVIDDTDTADDFDLSETTLEIHTQAMTSLRMLAEQFEEKARKLTEEMTVLSTKLDQITVDVESESKQLNAFEATLRDLEDQLLAEH